MSAVDAAPAVESGSYAAADGRTLRYRVVRAVPAPGERTLVYLHGIESHGGWFLPAARRLAALGTSTVLLDRRGSGLNREPEPGHAPSAAALVDDVLRLRRGLPCERVALAGLSWGGKLALAAALAEPGLWTHVVLVTPGLVPRVDLSPWQKLRLLACWALRPRARFEIPIGPELFTDTPRWLEFIRRDPERLRRVTADFLRASVALDLRLRARLAGLAVPALLLLAERDRIVDNRRTRALFERAPAALRTVELWAGASHALQFDHVDRLARRIDAFTREERR